MDVPDPALQNKTFDYSPDSLLGNKYANPDYLFQKQVGVVQQVANFVTDPQVVSTFYAILYLLSLFFLSIIFYTIVRLFEIRKKEEEHTHHELEEYAHKHKEKEKAMAEDEAISRNPRWRQVLHLLFSENQNDWKLSVIEADAMLETLLGEQGYAGANLGEKLKSAGEKGFRHLNNAWDVHTVRNRVAHEGSVFELSHHEAKRAISIYEQIFREYGYI